MSLGIVDQFELPQVQHDKSQTAAQLIHVMIQESEFAQIPAVECMRQRVPVDLLLNLVQLLTQGAVLFLLNEGSIRPVGDFQHDLELSLWKFQNQRPGNNVKQVVPAALEFHAGLLAQQTLHPSAVSAPQIPAPCLVAGEGFLADGSVFLQPQDRHLCGVYQTHHLKNRLQIFQ